MEILFSSHFMRAYHRAPERIQRAFDKQLTFLEENIRHPSLRAKKYDEAYNVWYLVNYHDFFLDIEWRLRVRNIVVTKKVL